MNLLSLSALKYSSAEELFHDFRLFF